MDSVAMLDAYMRRKVWESKLQAAAVVEALGKGMSGTPAKNGTYNAGHREISPEEMLQRIR